MSLDRMVIIIGEESPSKLSLLENLQTNYNLFIPKRITTNSEYADYPSLYQVVGDKEVTTLVSKGIVKSIGYHKDNLSFNISPEIGQGIADTLNGFVPGIILNADITELGYYLKMYPTASVLGYAEELEDLEQFKEVLPDIITKADILSGDAINKVLSCINNYDADKTISI